VREGGIARQQTHLVGPSQHVSDVVDFEEVEQLGAAACRPQDAGSLVDHVEKRDPADPETGIWVKTRRRFLYGQVAASFAPWRIIASWLCTRPLSSEVDPEV
jgi:hypothetical protein